MTEKRRFINQLPAVHQTESLKKFFGSTVDHIFQPGKSEKISGYIGRIPDYTDPEKDFIIRSPDIVRQTHQLEPTMITKDLDTGDTNRVLFYDDLNNYLRGVRGNTDNQSRLYSSERYSWCPPCSPDKLINFSQYFWFGDDPDTLPHINVFSPTGNFIGDGETVEFFLPPVVASYNDPEKDETIMVFVEGVLVEDDNYTIDEERTKVIFSEPPKATGRITLFRYGDLLKLIRDKVTFYVADMNVQGVEFLESDMRIRIFDGYTFKRGYDRKPFEKIFDAWNGADIIPPDDVPWDFDSLDYRPTDYIVEGVNERIELYEYITDSPFPIENPKHVVIDRRSQERSPWVRMNYWFHEKSYRHSGKAFLEKQAKRPIIEFMPNIKLHDYGWIRVEDVNVVVDRNTQILYSENTPFVGYPAEDDPIWDTLVPISSEEMNGKLPNHILITGWKVLEYGDRLLMTNDLDYRQMIVEVFDRTKFDQLSQPVEPGIILVNQVSQEGDVVLISASEPESFEEFPFDDRSEDFRDFPREFWFNGTEWKEARTAHNNDPLFELFTYDGISHSDLPNNLFSGNRLIGFKNGTHHDPILNRGISFDQYGDIIFDNEQVTKPTEFIGVESEPYKGYQFFKKLGRWDLSTVHVDFTTLAIDEDTVQIDWDKRGTKLSPDELFNSWYPQNVDVPFTVDSTEYSVDDTETDLSQRIEVSEYVGQTFDPNTGLWSIPSTLATNADHDEVREISNSEWFEHFVTLIENQPSFDGLAVASNNWKDTEKNLSLGNKIIQHRHPLLKTMLMASDENFSIPDGIRFVDREYTQFKGKFAFQAIQMKDSGEIDDDMDVNEAVDKILEKVNFAKTINSPFALSSVGGGNHYIPQTLASQGIFKPTKPEFFVDDTYSTPIRFLRGHDNSLIPPFNDIRDRVLFALENKIYESISEKIKNEPPVVDYYSIIDGAWRTGLFSKSETDKMFEPHFRRWVVLSRLDYQVNDGYDPNDPFTWNYRGLEDVNGEAMPGNWRGIYLYYYDTSTPHLTPWEMVGFSTKPDWWEFQYGQAPYGRNNTKLWEDMRDGVIRGWDDNSTDTKAEFVRNSLMSFLPVDDAGNLLNPIQVGIFPSIPSRAISERPWEVSDMGPVEFLWYRSSSYQYAKGIVSFLMRPNHFVEEGWDTMGRLFLNDGQMINEPARIRQRSKDIQVYGEGTNPKEIIGIQPFVVEHMIARSLDPSHFGNAVRGLDVRLAHRMGGFTSSDSLRSFADNFGLIPSENIEVYLHRSMPIREAVYGGLLIQWTGRSYIIISYNSWTEDVITYMPPDTSSRKTTIRVGDNTTVNQWRPNVHYQIKTFIEYEGSVYSAVRSHTSGANFLSERDTVWKAEPDFRDTREVTAIKYEKGEGVYTTVRNGYESLSIQEIADIIFGYERWLLDQGFVFDEVDPLTGEIQDWTQAVKNFLRWAGMNWEPGNFIVLSPGASTLKFNTDHGYVLNVERSVNGLYSLLDRTGRPIPKENTFVTRLDSETKIKTVSDDLFGAYLRIGEIEHVLIYSNKTIFNDVIYQPLFDLRQPRLRLIGHRTTPWEGRLDAKGYIIDGNELLPNFHRSAEDVREMFDIESAERRILWDRARNNSGYQTRSYLDNLLVSDVQQFEFYQGAIQQKGAPFVLDKLARSTFVEQERDLNFLEEWAIFTGQYGAVDMRKEIVFKLTRGDIRSNPQYIEFGEGDLEGTILNIPFNSSRWINDSPNENEDIFVNLPFLQMTRPPKKGEVAEHQPMPSAGPVRVDEVDHIVFHHYDLNNLYDEIELDPANTDNAFGDGQRIWMYSDENGNWDVWRIDALVPDNEDGFTYDNVPISIITNNESSDVPLTVAQITIGGDGPTDLGSGLDFYTEDVGGYLLIQGRTNTTPNLEGFYKIIGYQEVDGAPDTIEIDISESFSPFNMQVAGIEYAPESPKPYLYVLRRMRFSKYDDLRLTNYSFKPNELVYLDTIDDDDENEPKGWHVLKRSLVETNVFGEHRRQPPKVDAERIDNSLIFSTKTKITNRTISPDPLVMDDLVVYDPIFGFIPGVADRELSYKLDTDPALYSGQNRWGEPQLGELWWDLSTVRYLIAETDDLVNEEVVFIDTTIEDASIVRIRLDNAERLASRKQTELDYRTRYWGKIAPKSSVDIYEWTRGDVHPSEVEGARTVDFVEITEFDREIAGPKTVYYYWMKNPNKLPNKRNRNISARRVSNILADVENADIPWLAPVATNGMLIGGISQFMTDDTALRIRLLDPDYNDEQIHEEWTLLRQDDQNQLPSESLWDAFRNSMVGYNDFLQPVPDPTLNDNQRVGLSVRPRRTLFAQRTGQTIQEAIMDARRAYVEQVNRILKKNYLFSTAQGFEQLATTVDIPQRYLLEVDKGTSLRLDYPLPQLYDFIVSSETERNDLLKTDEMRTWLVEFIDGVREAAPRILVTNYTSPQPSWAIWTYKDRDTLLDYRTQDEYWVSLGDREYVRKLENPDDFLTVATLYDKIVDTKDDLQTAEGLEFGDRVLVRNDRDQADLWAIWKYVSFNADDNIRLFEFETAQTYRLQDFWEYSDWYAEGYSPEFPPPARVPIVRDLIAARPETLNSSFVQVDDDGTGRWVWNVWDEDRWVRVAAQNGTMQLLERFYDPNIRFGYGIESFENPQVRDGGFEFRQLYEIIRKDIMTDRESVDLFFSFLNYIHAQQDYVSWAFKTSFLSVAGYNTRLTTTPVQRYDNTENLLTYLEEVKPYRVKTRIFIQSYAPDVDPLNLLGTDFDKPIYFDNELAEWRRLVIGNERDMPVLQFERPWADWYHHHLDEQRLVRSFDMKINFDRVGVNSFLGWSLMQIGRPWDAEKGFSTASERFINTSDEIDFEKFRELMGMGYRGDLVLDGSSFQEEIEFTANGANFDSNTSNIALHLNSENFPELNDLHNPYYDDDHPQELVPVGFQDVITIKVQEKCSTGAPSQKTTVYRNLIGNSSPHHLNFMGIPQGIDGIEVYADGKKLPQEDIYLSACNDLIVDYSSNIAEMVIRTYSAAAYNGAVCESKSYTISNSSVFSLDEDAFGKPIDVFVDGIRLGDEEFELLNGNTAIGFVDELVGNSVHINVYTANSIPIIVNRDRYDVDASIPSTSEHTWELLNQTLIPNRPEFIGTIVEMNGIQLQPPRVYYGEINGRLKGAKFSNIGIEIEREWETDKIKIWMDGDYVPFTIERLPNDVIIWELGTGALTYGWDSANAWETDIESDFVLIGTRLYCLNLDFQEGDMIVVIEDENEIDYTISDGILTMFSPRVPDIDTGFGGVMDPEPDVSDVRIEVTSFSDPRAMCIQQYTFYGDYRYQEVFNENLFPIFEGPATRDHIILTIDGLFATFGKDYTVVNKWIDGIKKYFIRVTNALPGQRIIATVFCGRPNREPSTYIARSKDFMMSRMGHEIDTSNFDIDLLDHRIGHYFDMEYDPSEEELQARKIHSRYKMEDGWELLESLKGDELVLMSNVYANSSNISLTFANTGGNGVCFRYSENPVMVPYPEDNDPGVIWIDSERIEYYGYDNSNGIITLSNLHRNTDVSSYSLEERILFMEQITEEKTIFEFDTTGKLSNLEVYIRKPNNQLIGLQVNNDFSIQRSKTEPTKIILNEFPDIDDQLIIAEYRPTELNYTNGTLIHGETLTGKSIFKKFIGG